MTSLENLDVILLLIASLLVLIIFILTIVQNFRRRPTIIGRTAIILLIIGLLFLLLLVFRGQELGVADWAQTLLLFGLVLVTGVYAMSTARQAAASVEMAGEMREQRRPIVVSEVVFPTHLSVIYATKDDEGDITCDHFKIRNLGTSPAIELEVLLLNQEEGLLNSQRQTFLAQSDAPVEFYPQGLEGQLNSTCYLLCRYRLSEEGKMWYLTKLPFVPIKSQRGDRILIQPKELEFSRAFEKRSY